jgi:hypothetical protein
LKVPLKGNARKAGTSPALPRNSLRLKNAKKNPAYRAGFFFVLFFVVLSAAAHGRGS